MGPVTRRVEEVLTFSRPYGVAEAMERVTSRARKEMEASERKTIAEEVDRLVRESDLSRAEFASRIGTSASRLSTYATGKVMPSAALLVRMQRVAVGNRFAFLAGAWSDRVRISDDFNELPDGLAESLDVRS